MNDLQLTPMMVKLLTLLLLLLHTLGRDVAMSDGSGVSWIQPLKGAAQFDYPLVVEACARDCVQWRHHSLSQGRSKRISLRQL